MKPRCHQIRRRELDAAYFHLYGIARDDVDYIMETFPIVKRKDVAAHGDLWPHQASDPRNLRRHAAGRGQRPDVPDAARSAAGASFRGVYVPAAGVGGGGAQLMI